MEPYKAAVAVCGALIVLLLAPAGEIHAATDKKVTLTLQTTDADGEAITQQRFYFVYRPDNLPRSRSAPMVLVMECRGGDLPARFFHRKADQAGFVLVSCAVEGNSTGNRGWVAGDPRIAGYEDIDYTTAVIDRVAADENCKDAFICGLSKGGHMTCAYACVRAGKIKAAADVDEFMGLTTNIPAAPVPMIFFHGSRDGAVPYAMMKDTVDAWRARNGLMAKAPVTTFERSPLSPGAVTMAAWSGATPVAFVTIVGGTHAWPAPGMQTGFDVTDAIWAFFAQFVTPAERAPAITANPTDNVQAPGHPASFHAAAVGEGPLTFQWQRNGKDIPGATASWYTTPPATGEDDGAVYRVTVSNGFGKAVSGGAKLALSAAAKGPEILEGPKDQVAVAGRPARFSVKLATQGPGTKVQWQKNGMDIAGATETTCMMPAAITADCGATLRAVVTDESGSATSVPATLTVTPAPGAPEILANPARQRLHPGEPGRFTVTAKSDEPMRYQWQKGRLTTNYVDIPGATEATCTTPPATMKDDRTLFRCIVTNAAGASVSAGELMLVTPAGGG